MNRIARKSISVFVSLLMIMSFAMPTWARDRAAKEMTLTILGTSDMHGNLTSWSYEANKDYANSGFARTATLVKETKAQNPNTLVIDNGDTIQGTILTDDLYNSDLTKLNPVMDIMNVIGYDSMTLGNHEFNFGTEMIKKIEKEADFPILSANTYVKETGQNFVTPYIVKEVGDVKVGILGLTVPSIPRWDANKEGVKDLEFKHMADEAEKYVKILKEKEQVDVIVATAHAGLESRHEADGSDSAKLVAERCPEIDAFLIGHDHETVQEEINGVTIAAPMKDREVVRFDIQLINKDGKWEVKHTSSTILPLKDYEPDPVTTKATEKYHNETMEFLKDSIGEATEDFHPAPEVKGIPEAQVRDTALIDLINKVQLEATGADVAAAALFRSTSNLPKGELNFANVFDIYQYANTLVGVQVTGKELKAYMEWSAAYYNTYKPGDLTISFNPTIRGYAYDMFEGVDYEIDISKPVGSRITNVMYKGEPLADDTVLKLAINDYRYSGIGPDGEKILSGTPYMESAPKALRTYIKEYIEKEGTMTPVTNNNWKIIGTNWDEELHTIAVKAVNDGVLTIPKSSDGRTENVRAITEADLIHAGLHPTYKDYMAVIHTNDTHTRIEAGDGMGFARVATKVNNMRESYGEDHVLVLDAGDTLHGLPIVTTTKGEAMTKILNTIGYDAMASGNHDYNYGYERLVELDKIMGGKVLSANVMKDDGTPLLTPYIIKEVAGKKVAIFGLSTESTTYQTHPKNVAGLTFKSPSEVAGEMVKELEDKADIIIALTHLGSYEDEAVETSFDVAEKVKGIDLIVDGHSHTVLPEGKKIGDTLIVQAGEYIEQLGQVNFYFKEDGTFDIVPVLLTKQEGMSLSEDDAVKAVIKEIKKDFEVITSEVVGQTDMKLVGEREVVRKGESNLGNLITNALLETTGADVALTNGGGIRASIENGDITKKDVITVLPFGNYGVMIEVTGQDIKDALEVGVAKYPEANGAFSHVAGMSYTFDPSKEVGSRVVEVLVGGKPLDLKATYKLATNDFIAAGGDNYTMFAECKSLGEFSALDEIVIEYLQTKGTEGTELQNRINVVEPEAETQPVELGQAA